MVYYINFLFWTESARDHADGLLSFKTFPTCFISDVSVQVARHMNNRSKQLFFQPSDGRLCLPSKSNISLAAKKELQIKMPWVQNLNCCPSQPPPNDANRWIMPHPIALYALYDRFHQKKQKRPEEKLRSLNLCHDLRTQVNSLVAEQFNRELAAIRYSLTQMNEAHFKHTVRVLVELHNLSINSNFIASVGRQSSTPLIVGEHGITMFDSSIRNQDFLASSSEKPASVDTAETFQVLIFQPKK